LTLHAGQPTASPDLELSPTDSVDRLVPRYRGEPAPLVRSGDGSCRSGRFEAVLGGDFDLLMAEET
jgi:hypothetical protein